MAVRVLAPAVSAKTQLKLEPLKVAALPLQVTRVTPERASVTGPVRVVGEVKRMLPSAGEVSVNTGGVLSILIPFAATGALTLPALSVQVPEAACLTPSLVRLSSGEQ